VPDPAQNHSFRDHYLDVELDLSEVVFIATANMAETIPGPLLDRMEVIRFDGYTVDEKVAIARGYLWPRQRERAGLREDEVSIDDITLQLIVSQYTREAGVRQLERGLDEHVVEDASFHVHVPAGAIPKDGPSAGITMTTALASLLTGRPVKHTVGMTGEVTLQGRVLPIGGLKQKALAAHAAGLTDVIIPERNRADLDDIPEDGRAEMSCHPVMSLDEVLE